MQFVVLLARSARLETILNAAIFTDYNLRRGSDDDDSIEERRGPDLLRSLSLAELITDQGRRHIRRLKDEEGAVHHTDDRAAGERRR